MQKILQNLTKNFKKKVADRGEPYDMDSFKALLLLFKVAT